MPIDKDELRRKTELKRPVDRPSTTTTEGATVENGYIPPHQSNGEPSPTHETIAAPIDINVEARQGGEHAIARKVETLHSAQQRGKNLADEEAVTELAAYVQQANKRQGQMKQFMQSYRQGLNGALSTIAVDLPEGGDEDFFGAVPEFSLPSTASNLLNGTAAQTGNR